MSYNVYLDTILQSQDDILNIGENISVSIIREDGFDSAEQILREKTDMEMSFIGDAYTYIAGQRRDAACTQILNSIEYVCPDESKDFIFEGFMSQNDIELQLSKKCIAKAGVIKDNSFSGLIRDYLDVEVPLYGNKTKGCTDLIQVIRTITMYDDPANLSSTVDISAFDAYDILDYLVKYFTDGLIGVQSDYLTGVTTGRRVAFTLGFNLHNSSGNKSQVYPTLSISQVFTELRKKYRLYMVIEYDSDGIPYLKIEPESYSYDSEVLMELTDIPNGAVEKMDVKRIFNSIKVGSTQIELADDATPDYQQDSLVAWNNEAFNSCSGCIADRNSEGVVLDLVSDPIIDSNMIYEGLNAGIDYDHDEDLFMFEYEVDSSNVSSAVITSYLGKNIYNYYINNENVINNWLGYVPICVTLDNSTENYFLAKDVEDTIATGSLDETIDYTLRLTDEIIDNNNTYSYEASWPPVSLNSASVFTAPTGGAYKFGAKATFELISLDCLDSEDSSTYSLGFWHFDSGGTKVAEYYMAPVSYPNYTENITIEYVSPNINLLVGENVIPVVRIVLSDNCTTPGAEIQIRDASFYLAADITDCETIETSTDAKPFILTFQYDLCHTDFMRCKNNKRGKWRVANQDYWIKEIKYVPQKLSTITLLGAESLGGVC